MALLAAICVGHAHLREYTDAQISAFSLYREKYAGSHLADRYSLEAFVQKVQEMEVHNAREEAGYKMDINQFTGVDLTAIMKETKFGGLGKAFKCPTEAAEFST